MNETNEKSPRGSQSGLRNRVFIGFVLIVTGVLTLLNYAFDVFEFVKLWPLLLLIPIVFMAVNFVTDYKKNKGSVFPIVLLSAFTAFFLYLNFDGWDSNIGALWPIFLLIPGVSFLILFFFTHELGVLIPGSILSLLGVAFLFGFNGSIRIFSIAGILILVGIAILIQSIFKK